MTDLNDHYCVKGDLYNFRLENDLIESVSELNPDLKNDPTYLWDTKQIDYIFDTILCTVLRVVIKHYCRA